MVELAITLPFILLLVIGSVEVVLMGRAYLALLESTVVSSRLGSSGETFYDDSEILTLTDQVLSREGYNSSDLVDVIITRADLVNGTSVENYQVFHMNTTNPQTPFITTSLLLSRMEAGDPNVSMVAVEVYYNHRLLFGGAHVLPDPLVLRAFTINALPR